MSSERKLALACLAVTAYLAYQSLTKPPTVPPSPGPAPAPKVDPCPGPNCPDPGPGPKRPRRPWASAFSPAVAGVGAEEPAVDLLAIPSAGRPRNTGGTDGAGLCVFTSIQYAAWWQNEPRLRDFQAKMKREPGGGYPSKVDKMIAKYAPGVKYVQYQGRDPSIIELALKTGRVPCITWGGSHMLCCVHLDATRAAIVDNNAPDRVQWMNRSDFLQRWTTGGGGWVFVLLNSPPPPPPRSTAGPVAHQRHLEADAIIRPVPTIEGGLQWAPPDREMWSFNGTVCTEAVSVSDFALALEDDAARLHLTVIGADAAERARVLADLDGAAELSGTRGRYLVQGYDPAAWEMAVGFVTSGRPTIYLQARDGRPLLRLDQYRGPADLAQRLRRADPSYNPASDPNGGSAAWPSWLDWSKFDLSKVPPPVLLLGAVGVFLLLRKGGDS